MLGLFRKKKGPAERPSNAELRAALAKQGDDGRTPRRVVHSAQPALRGLNAEKHEVRRIVTGIGNVLFTDTPEMRGVTFEHRREVASSDFDRLCERFDRTLAQRGWIYDGWTCPDGTGDGAGTA